MSSIRRLNALGMALLLLSLSIGCGGGGGGGTTGGGTPPTPSAPKTLAWTPPKTYSDGSALNPATDIDSYEIYVKDSPTFTSSDIPKAQVGAIDSVTGQPATSFNLSNLSPYLSSGITYYVSIRTKTKNGEKSVFSVPASFSL